MDSGAGVAGLTARRKGRDKEVQEKSLEGHRSRSSFRWRAWLGARLRRFYRWRHGGEFARLLILDQIFAFDGIAGAAAKVRGHKLGDWRIQDGWAAATCIRCGRTLVVYYCPLLEPDMDGSALRHGCLRGSP